MNAVVAAVLIMLVLSLCRIHVVVALIIGAISGGLVAGMSLEDTINAFNSGLGGGATVALSYATLGAFAVAIGKSGLAHALADKALAMVGRQDEGGAATGIRFMIIGLLLAVAVSSQNILPIHIAFIPLVVPPLLYVMAKLNMDRRLVACVLTFGLITPYMFLPVGFGGIYLNEILLANVADNGVDASNLNAMSAMALPGPGVVFRWVRATTVALLDDTARQGLVRRVQHHRRRGVEGRRPIPYRRHGNPGAEPLQQDGRQRVSGGAAGVRGPRHAGRGVVR